MTEEAATPNHNVVPYSGALLDDDAFKYEAILADYGVWVDECVGTDVGGKGVTFCFCEVIESCSDSVELCEGNCDKQLVLLGVVEFLYSFECDKGQTEQSFSFDESFFYAKRNDRVAGVVAEVVEGDFSGLGASNDYQLLFISSRHSIPCS